MIDLRYGRDCVESLREMEDGTVHCCVTSPPYWGLRDYGCEGQIGLEPTPDAYVAKMVEVFREVRRVLRDDGTLWLNVGDSYASNGVSGYQSGLDEFAKRERKQENNGPKTALRKHGRAPTSDGMKPKDLCLIPWRLALALQADGWWCRSVICWAKKSCMPESVTDRPTNSWEPIFLLAKSAKYFYDAEAVREPHEHGIKSEGEGGEYYGGKHGKGTGRSAENGNVWNPKVRNYNPAGRNQRNVWHLGPEPYAAAHFATFPSEIPRRAILAGTSARGCCPVCLAPWVRVVEKVPTGKKQKTGSNWDTGAGAHGSFHRNGRETKPADQNVMASKTIGWSQSCTCPPHEPIACRVLDPFSGSATTGQVAFSLGRDYIGLDLSTEYLELARERCGGLFCK